MYSYIIFLCIPLMPKFNMVTASAFLSLIEHELNENVGIFKDYIKYQ